MPHSHHVALQCRLTLRTAEHRRWVHVVCKHKQGCPCHAAIVVKRALTRSSCSLCRMESLPEERLRELLKYWGVPADRAHTHAQVLATVGVTVQVLARSKIAILAAILADGREQVTPIDHFDANTIVTGAAAVNAGELDVSPGTD